MKFNTLGDLETFQDTDVIELEHNHFFHLVLWNDDFNTFDWVIKTLIEVCNHDILQAEQCTLLVHHKGKCSVKEGNYDTLKIMYDSIIERGIQATIEELVF